MLLPKAASQLSYLVLYLLQDATVDESSRVSGGEYLLWLHDWSIWDNEMRLIGVNLFDRLRLGYGLDVAIEQEPAMLFSGSEIGALISFALIPLVFLWDFYIVPATAEYFVFGCHDEWIGFSGREEAVESALVAELPKWTGSTLRHASDNRLAGINAQDHAPNLEPPPRAPTIQ